MKQYYYYACGNNVPEIRFKECSNAWDYVRSHNDYDCVVEMWEV